MRLFPRSVLTSGCPCTRYACRHPRPRPGGPSDEADCLSRVRGGRGLRRQGHRQPRRHRVATCYSAFWPRFGKGELPARTSSRVSSLPGASPVQSLYLRQDGRCPSEAGRAFDKGSNPVGAATLGGGAELPVGLNSAVARLAGAASSADYGKIGGAWTHEAGGEAGWRSYPRPAPRHRQEDGADAPPWRAGGDTTHATRCPRHRTRHRSGRRTPHPRAASTRLIPPPA